MTASQWWPGGGDAYSKNRKTKRNKRKEDSKTGEAVEVSAYYLADEYNNQKWKIMISNKR